MRLTKLFLFKSFPNNRISKHFLSFGFEHRLWNTGIRVVHVTSLNIVTLKYSYHNKQMLLQRYPENYRKFLVHSNHSSK